jgi:L-seryl-tRNA(Ser) seleniumtransferase
MIFRENESHAGLLVLKEVQMSGISRRKLLRTGGQAILAVGVAACGPSLQARSSSKSPKAAANGVDYYQKLGVTPFINAAGTYTVLTASIMPDEVQAAVAQAAKSPVNLNELHDAAGAYLAKRLRCEAALVTAGAAAALVVGTAACVTMGNDSAILNIPTDMNGLKNEVIVQKTHRYGYDHAIRNCGVRFVEVETLPQYEQAFTDRTVMTHFFNAGEAQISREDWVRVAHQHGVPCFNDAAADVPPISNLWNYTQMGFDLVTFSGGKGLRGPQCTGLLLGRKDLIDAARKNNSPNSNTVGRGMKVAKEEIVGLVAAVDWFLSQNDAAMEAEHRARAERIAAQLKNIPTLQTQIFIPAVAANHVPHLLITYDQNRVKITGAEVMQKMREGKPRIELNPSTGGAPASAGLPGGANTIVVGVWMMQPGEDLIVAKRLREVLQGAMTA